MVEGSLGARVFRENRVINYERTLAFFEARAKTAVTNPLTATMYQSPALADRRNQAEKQIAIPLMDLRFNDRVLDLGCGSGRWALDITPSVSAYLGLDFSEGLLKIARAQIPAATFQCMPVNAIDIDALIVAPPFKLVICSGILAYLNDRDVTSVFASVSQIAAPESRFYIREPIAKSERLTLDDYWSEELGASYSAVYRTRFEYLDLFSSLRGFQVREEGEPFPPELQNRAETEQHFFLLERRGAE
jgi:ubiquinone/menaquinone biosynthesis C-methylase UbiE